MNEDGFDDISNDRNSYDNISNNYNNSYDNIVRIMIKTMTANFLPVSIYCLIYTILKYNFSLIGKILTIDVVATNNITINQPCTSIEPLQNSSRY